MYQTNSPLPPKELLPTMYDLPSEEAGKPSLPDFLRELLCLTFRPPNYPPDQILVASDLNLYYDSHHPQWYKRLDWVAVLALQIRVLVREDCSLYRCQVALSWHRSR